IGLLVDHLPVVRGDLRPVEVERRRHLDEDVERALEREQQQVEERRDPDEPDQDEDDVGDDAAEEAPAHVANSSRRTRPTRNRNRIVTPIAATITITYAIAVE